MPNKSKIIVTNRKAMIEKYTMPGWETILDKLSKLTTFDSSRCIDTQVLYLDDYVELPGYNVLHAENERENKVALDYIYNKYKPNYLIILGAQDIVPFQSLLNPSYFDYIDDLEEYMPSDLPYACEHGYSIYVNNFLNPTRIVSRIPDVFEDSQKGLDVLINTIYNIINMPRIPRTEYKRIWSVCTQMRTTPMEETLADMNFLANDYKQSPPNGPVWPPNPNGEYEDYEKHVHFHIVHGEKDNNILYGEDNLGTESEAIYGDYINGNLNIGTVVLERACYGSQLYNPNINDDGLPLANIYLRSGAVAMIGSCVENFSNPNGRLLGDYMVSSFYNHLKNRSIGEAFLLARQSLLRNGLLTNYANQTMFGAFVLYGDASIVPIASKSFYEKAYNTISSEHDPDIPVEEAISICYPGPPILIIPGEIFKLIEVQLQEDFGVEYISDAFGYHLYENGIENTTIQMYVIYTKQKGKGVWYEFKYDVPTNTISFVCEYSY